MVLLRHAACTRAFFFFNDTATTEIYTLSLHDALPILRRHASRLLRLATAPRECPLGAGPGATVAHSATLPAAPRHLRQSAHPARTARGGVCRQPTPGSAPDAHRRSARAGRADLPRESAVASVLRPASQPLVGPRRHASRSDLGRRHHLSPSRWSVALSRRRAGPVLPSGARLEARPHPRCPPDARSPRCSRASSASRCWTDFP